MRLTIFLLLLLNARPLFCQTFSVESIINKHHWKNETSPKELFIFTKNRFYNIVDSFRERSLYKNQSISIQIQDTLAEKTFSIQKGDTVIQIYKNRIVGEDIVSGYESVRDVNGNITNYFLLDTLQNRHPDWYDVREDPKQKDCYFYVIGTRDVTIQNPLMVSSELSNSHLIKILNAVEKEVSLNKQFEYYIMTLPNISSRDTIKTRLLQFCDFRMYHYRIDDDIEDDYILQVNSTHRKKTFEWDFSVLVLSTFKTPLFIPFSEYEFSFIARNKSYFLFKSFAPETGARGRNLYTYNQATNKLDLVFSDWTWSD